MKISIKRVYEEPNKDDGKRILIDRLWPRGLTKEKAKVDLWFKDIAPSTELRQWFGHDPTKWAEFQSRYTKELNSNSIKVTELKKENATKQEVINQIVQTANIMHGNYYYQRSNNIDIMKTLELPFP